MVNNKNNKNNKKSKEPGELIGEVFGYKVYLSPQAQEDIKDLTPEERKKFLSKAISQLASTRPDSHLRIKRVLDHKGKKKNE